MMILSTLALAILILGVPFMVHLLFEWERGLDGSSFEIISDPKPDIMAEDYEGTQNYTYPLAEIEVYPGFLNIFYHLTEQPTVVWNRTGYSMAIMSPNYTAPEEGNIIHAWTVPTGKTVQDLIDADQYQLNLEWNSTKAVRPYLVFCPVSNSITNLAPEGDYFSQVSNGTKTGTWNVTWDLVDLLEVQAVRGSNAQLVLVLTRSWEGHQNEDTDFEVGDVILFKIKMEQTDTGWLTQEFILKTGAAVIGILCIILGVVATPYYNPGSPNKGIVDKILAKIPVIGRWITSKVSKKKKTQPQGKGFTIDRRQLN
jgi:hypothetical protein